MSTHTPVVSQPSDLTPQLEPQRADLLPPSQARRRRRGARREGRMRGGMMPWILTAIGLLAITVVSGLFYVVRAVVAALLDVAHAVLGSSGGLVTVLLLVGLVALWKRRQRLPRGAVAQTPALPSPVPEALPALLSPAASLARETERWLTAQRSLLPDAAQPLIESMQTKLGALASQLKEATQASVVTLELKNLLEEELHSLVDAYLKVPDALAQRAGASGSTPEQQLFAGLTTIETQLNDLLERLAAPELQALAVHERFLDLKYNSTKLP